MEEHLQNTGAAKARIHVALEAQLLAASKKVHPRDPAISQGAPLRQIPDAPATLAESLLRAARQSPEKGIVYVQNDGAETFQSYPELLEEAERVLTGLRKLGLQPGDKVIFQLDRNQDFISVFWGCVFGGFIPVPQSIAPTYQQVTGTVSKLRNAWKLIDPRVVVSSRILTSAIRSATELPQAEGFRVEAIDDVRVRERTQYWHASRPDDLALLLLTSGSTGVPKAVMQSHHALLHRSAATAQKNGFTSDDVSLNWLPMDHVGGIVMCHLRDVFLRCQQIQVQTEFILGDPLKWLDLIERHRASMTWAPNFAYGLINAAEEEVRTQKWDLSSMRFILNGGEGIVAKTARRFLELLAPFGLPATAMHPAWGMSETSSGVTCSDRFSLDLTTDDDPFVEVGSPIPGVSLRIVDAHNKVIEEETIGSLQVKGPPITGGYYNNPQLNREAFTDDGWFHTGDLGFLRRGRLTITGREKDVIIVNGVNYHSQTIEAVIEEMDGVERSYTAACAVRLDDVNTDGLAVFFHPSSWKESDLIELLRSVHREVVKKVGVNPDYLLPIQKDQIPKTSIGKIQRTQLIDRFRRGEFDAILRRVQILNGNPNTPPAPLAEADANDPEGSEAESSRVCRAAADELLPGTNVERQLAGIWQEILGVSHVGIRDNFFDLGGHSLLAGRVIYRVREAFGVQLSLRCLFDAPTVAGISEAIGRAREANQNGRFPPLVPVSRENIFPLSFSQRRLWFLDQWNPNSSAYNIPAAFRLTGPLNVTALELSLNEIVRRHESLRTKFRVEGGQPTQEITPAFAVTLDVIDLRALGEIEREDEAKRLLTEQTRRPFDLTEDSLVRPSLLGLGEEDNILLLTLHHIVCDGWSLGVLCQELSVLYRAFSNNTPSPLPEIVIQYADYAVWQREFLKGEVLEKQRTYWKTKLEGAPTVLNLPLDRPRPTVQSYRGARRFFELPRELTQGLKLLSRKEGATLFMTLLAAFQSLLYRYTEQEDIVVGTPIAGRDRTDLESLIGFFVNTLVLRSDVSGNPTFRELLERVRELALGAYAHQDLPFEKLVEDLRQERHLSHLPLFQVMFSLQNVPIPVLQLSGLAATRLEIDCDTTKFDLTLTMVEEAESLTGTVEYNTDLFDSATIERMAGHYQKILEGIAANPDLRLSELPLLTEAERYKLLVEWNDTGADYPRDKCIHELFEEQVEKTPDAIAVVFEDQRLTYRELNERANRLAHHLQSLGVGPEVLVGICVERSPEMVIGILGILKAGGAYVPLDPDYPVERLEFMVEDTAVPVLLTQKHLAAMLPKTSTKVVFLDADRDVSALWDKRNPAIAVKPENLAYVIYTSGSTGRPKGVMISHMALCNHMVWMQGVFPLMPADKVLQKTLFTFDASIWEFFAPLLAGASLIVAAPEDHRDSTRLIEIINKHQVTVFQVVPSLFNMLIEDNAIEKCKSLRRVFCGGEVLPVRLSERFLMISNADLINLYGPTEACIDATFRIVSGRQARDTISIGRPISNTQLYIVDKHLQLVPIGVQGELCLSGDGLARGYLNRPELTTQKFIPNPFSGEPGARLYKTGDLVRYLPDGNIEYLGRIDSQVKIRGFRIELGEIESVLSQHQSVRKAVVVAREEMPGDRQLVAYIVPAEAASLSVSLLKDFLSQKLPAFMIPSFYVLLDALPLTPNGKLDRKALPAPDGTGLISKEDFVSPRTPIEEMLAGIWCEVLELSQVGIHDNFFELGGHSLLATQVISRLRKVFEVEIPLRTLFESPTVEELAFALLQRECERETVEQRTALFLKVAELSEDGVNIMLAEQIRERDNKTNE